MKIKINKRRIGLRTSRSSSRRARSKYNRKIKIAREKDKEVVKVIEKMKKVSIKVLRGNKWQIEEKLVLSKRKVYMPKNKELRIKII